MYDPLHDKHPGEGEGYPKSYWAQNSGLAPKADGPLQNDIRVEVAVIGAGYTGLSCALELAKQGIECCVLEANQVAWGCSGRNAGFVLKGSGRLGFSQIKARWGDEVMRQVYREMSLGVERVEDLIADGLDCEPQPKGYLKLAHSPKHLTQLKHAAMEQQSLLGDELSFLSKNELAERYVDDKLCHGGVLYHDGFGLNPLKLAWGYVERVTQAGVSVYDGTPVLSIDTAKGVGYELITPQGRVTAKKVVLATNGYTPKDFHPILNGRSLPVLSQVIVTQALSDSQLRQCGLNTNQVIMDTRALKYYYRKLPDNRILFGGRGAITGAQAESDYYPKRLLSQLKKSYPALSDINYDYAWSGWINVALDDIPHLWQNDENSLFYAGGYCGSGLSFAAQAGARVAQRIAGQSIAAIPMYQSELPKFPLAPLRRLGQWAYFQYGRVADAL
ncbi:NAD(P)/FAD-dependent oxidoreductase [Paraferrimonas sedimenticola]|uniref:FAD-dependent oxidoreductase n=1 Tax=Paraferrimonas sedimenticola TaxID=375674 RepID=A0AA37W1P8_9GAMM|nr:FAD-binding oxidoreductase [Paraferrimonas sedimenticola]GLP96567.1 FAD-dependent oxidoreductase [Paraferrimonas sedimenticola]